ncbi:MAG: FkbM family methyltransferase [Alphaproteobacteria bacterium]|nr:FkbM family methyltransferase [Alphaproteobacteria bacterium]
MADVGSPYQEARRALRSFCPQPLLNWREARFYGRYGEVELHLLEFLCRRYADAIDVGANDGSYVHYMRRYAKHVIAYEPMPLLAASLRRKFPGNNVQVKEVALSDRKGSVGLRMPVVDGVVVSGCSTVSSDASATYPGYQGIDVPMNRLDNDYRGQCGFIKIDVEGHEQAVLDGALGTIARCRPRLLVEVDERLSPGGLVRARRYFDALNYRGFFVHEGKIETIDAFSIERMQDPAKLPDLTAPLQARRRFGQYLYNFIFLPAEEPGAILSQMSERLHRLAKD